MPDLFNWRQENGAPEITVSTPIEPSDAESRAKPFNKYRLYISSLKGLKDAIDRGSDGEEKIIAALNGQANVELRQRIDVEVRQKYGTFFTGTKLGARLLSKLPRRDGKRFFYDPTCGMGDLLLAAAHTLPLAKTLRGTLALWGRQLAGTDLHAEFIDGAKIRLMLLARQRHQVTVDLSRYSDDFFPYIRVGSGIVEEAAYKRANTLLMNPPYGVVKSPKGCKWAGGRVSEAATFMATALERVRPGTEVLAILPDILRSGSYSRYWRDYIGALSEVHMVKSYGIFDDATQVHVFISRLVRRRRGDSKPKKLWPQRRSKMISTVGTGFKVYVGRVVPHRDPEIGMEYPFVHPKNVRVWETMNNLPETRRFSGHVFSPPFVLIKRTSRKEDPYRATAAVVTGNDSVAVENHLIVCQPKNGTIEACQKLMMQLKTEATNAHLNHRICCRHLTVGSIEELPFDLS